MANLIEQGGVEALNQLISTDPPLFLTPTPDLSRASRLASQHLYATLKPHTPKSPFDQLLVDGFDVEQIWQQIDLQSQPLISTLRREIRRFEKNPDQISKSFHRILGSGKLGREVSKNGKEFEELDENEELEVSDVEDKEIGSGGDVEGEEMGSGQDEEAEDDDDNEEAEVDDDDEEVENDDDEEDKEEGDHDGGGIEDEFLSIKDMKKYLEEDEAREYAMENKVSKEDEEDDEGDDEEEDGVNYKEEDDRLAFFDANDQDDEDDFGNARYEDFFAKKKKTSRRKSKQVDGSDDSGQEDEIKNDKKKENLSTYEKQLGKLHAEIEEMEKANLEPKDWTMLGEVTAAKRPKNSALEVDLEFEHNARPPPVITEEDTASLEELIKKRVLEGNFDDVRRPPKVPLKAPKEVKELDDNKSKKGLAELYEGEYAQQNGFMSASQSQSELLKNEATTLFKKLCLKLDALSHFHFAPKPVVEDMSVQVNLPAFAMEEIAPMAVSDAAMLAPEEVFAGKGDIKEEAELTKSDRKRRRAQKKRRFKGSNPLFENMYDASILGVIRSSAAA
ncbi:hypothetical protein Dimus_004746 [Dionaea muscipula]